MQESNCIPKIIHYCWFGGNPKPKNIEKYMGTWHKILPDYTFMEWNESNFDIENSIPYVKEAYAAKKYAFVSDYVRLWALKEYGGVYLDTDIEIIKPFDELLEGKSLVTGFETQKTLITAFIACEKNEAHIAEFLKEYQNRKFKISEKEYDLTPINDRFTDLLTKYGLCLDNTRQTLPNGVEIYPQAIFCGNDIENSHLKVTDDTVTIHHFQMSWIELNWRTRFKYKVVVRALIKILGAERYDRLKKKFKK